MTIGDHGADASARRPMWRGFTAQKHGERGRTSTGSVTGRGSVSGRVRHFEQAQVTGQRLSDRRRRTQAAMTISTPAAARARRARIHRLVGDEHVDAVERADAREGRLRPSWCCPRRRRPASRPWRTPGSPRPRPRAGWSHRTARSNRRRRGSRRRARSRRSDPATSGPTSSYDCRRATPRR